MNHNYDLIINFETLNGELLSDDDVEELLNYAESMAWDIDSDDCLKIKLWKIIIAQGVKSRKIIL